MYIGTCNDSSHMRMCMYLSMYVDGGLFFLYVFFSFPLFLDLAFSAYVFLGF